MIFDTNVHFTVSDKWDNKKFKYQNKIKEKFHQIYKKYRLKGYACTGINLENYNHKKFIQKFKSKNAYLVPALNLNRNIKSQIDLIAKLGCESFKIHPRSFNTTIDKIDLDMIFYEANKRKFKIFLCTYFNDITSNFYTSDPKYLFSKVYKNYPNLKILLMHGGCERILEFAELCRFSKNILLDLSLTLIKYQDSSIDNDINYLFKHFDQKITLGSDYPEVDYDHFINRIKYFSKNLPTNKKRNIYYLNFIKFIEK